MKVTVDYDACMSTGGCTHLAPDVFEIRADGFLYVLVDEPPADQHDAVRSAADLCPTGAISISE